MRGQMELLRRDFRALNQSHIILWHSSSRGGNSMEWGLARYNTLLAQYYTTRELIACWEPDMS